MVLILEKILQNGLYATILIKEVILVFIQKYLDVTLCMKMASAIVVSNIHILEDHHLLLEDHHLLLEDHQENPVNQMNTETPTQIDVKRYLVQLLLEDQNQENLANKDNIEIQKPDVVEKYKDLEELPKDDHLDAQEEDIQKINLNYKNLTTC
jgi:hypothetical protein